VPTGSATPTTTLSQAVLPFAVIVGGEDALAGFAGAGTHLCRTLLYQINLEIPVDVTVAAVPLVIQVNGFSPVPVSLPLAQ
jgi:uncharacterized protein (TIGR03437 family)